MQNKMLLAKRIQAVLLTIVMCASVLSVSSCAKKNTATETVIGSFTASSAIATTQESAAETTAPAPEFAVNPITGIADMDLDNVGLRSVTVSINNKHAALPSRGLSQADAIYEFQTEGGQTRLLALYADASTIPEVGSLRSARIIACDLSAGTNSIFIHFGKNARVPAYATDIGLDHIDGNDHSQNHGQSVDGQIELGDGIYFWRDDVWKSERAIEHTAVTNGTQILRAINDLDISLTGETPSLFNFTTDSTPALANGTTANEIIVYFSQTNPDGTFTYDASTGLYAKSEYSGTAQIDETTGEQIAVKNVFVLFADIQSHGDTTIDAFLTEGGDGYYASEGKIVAITWSKDSANDPIVVMDTNGNEIQVNAGTSYINIVDNDVTSKFSYS